MSTESSRPAEMRVIVEFADFIELREQWNQLFDASATRCAPLRFEWLSEWWRVYGPVYGVRGGGLCVFTVWSGGRLIGALPLYRCVTGRFIQHARLQFISTGEAEFEETCPEYMDVMVRPGDEERVFETMQSALRHSAVPRWDDILLLDLAQPSSLLLTWVGNIARGDSIAMASRGCSLEADLSDGFEAYLSRLSPNSRQQARRTLRAAERAGATLELMSTPAEIDAGFDDLVSLHQSRWQAAGKPGCFSASRFTEFHRALARTLIPGSAAVLARLRVGKEPLAVIYGLLTAGKFDFYQCGVRLDGHGGVDRPGIVAHLLLMSHLAARGVTCYDFLRGMSEYKRRLATGVRPLASLHVERLTVRSVLWSAARRSRRRGRKLLDAAARLVRRARGAALLYVHHLCVDLNCGPTLVAGAVV